MTTYRKAAIEDWNGQVEWTYPGLQIALLASIRDELLVLNRILGCPNVAQGFRALQHIARQNEAAFKRRVKAAAAKRIRRKSS